MRFLSKLSFRSKIGLGTVVIVVLASLVSGLPASRMAARTLTAESKKRVRTLANNVALRAVEPMLSRNLLRLKDMVDESKAVDEDIDYAFILDNQGWVLAHTFRQGFPVELKTANQADTLNGVPHIQLLDTGKEMIYDVATPIMVGEAPLGTVRIGLSRARIQHQVGRLVTAMAGLAAAALLMAIVAAMFFASRVTRRINILRAYAESLVTGNLEPEIGVSRHSNCWEVRQCDLTECPAHGDERRRCWYLAGMFRPDPQESHSERGQSCAACPVYRRNRGDEIQDLAETLDVMALNLKNHIEELKGAEKEIRRQEQLMHTILDVTPDLVSLQGRDLTYRAVNRGFAAFVGRPSEEIIGAEDREIFPHGANRLLADAVPQVMDSVAPYQDEIELRRNGHTAWFHAVLVPVKDPDGNVIGVLRTARDVTEMKQVETQLLQAQKMESIGKLAGGVAHEINTPLGIILGYAQLLQEDVESESQIHQDLQIVERQAKVCRQIVADLLGFSRQATSAKREMCFNNSLMEAVSLVRHTFSLSDVEILTDVDDRMPIIYGDPEKLKQVWINLLHNARDAMNDGGTILVSSRLNCDAQQITATVADTGEGIPAGDLKRIFDPFFSTKAVGEGTGLGLSVSFGIIQDHQGSIRAISPVPPGTFAMAAVSPPNAGPGTMFIVDLPLDHSCSPDGDGGKGETS
jgi:PAS domain S-box-containing protein